MATKNKTSKKSNDAKLKALLEKREEYVELKSDIEDKLNSINIKSLELMDKIGVSKYDLGDKQVRKQTNTRTVYNIDGLRQLILQKIDRATSEKVIAEQISYRVDENALLTIIQEKFITVPQVRKFVTESSGKPYLRVYNAKT